MIGEEEECIVDLLKERKRVAGGRMLDVCGVKLLCSKKVERRGEVKYEVSYLSSSRLSRSGARFGGVNNHVTTYIILAFPERTHRPARRVCGGG